MHLRVCDQTLACCSDLGQYIINSMDEYNSYIIENVPKIVTECGHERAYDYSVPVVFRGRVYGDVEASIQHYLSEPRQIPQILTNRRMKWRHHS